MKTTQQGSLSKVTLSCALLVLCIAMHSAAQQNEAVPALVNFSGTLADLNGKPLTSVQGVTFLLYKDEQGGAPLWMETQNVYPDKNGRYTVQFGATTSEGLPRSDDDKELVFGQLDNEPVVNADKRVGQELAVSYEKFGSTANLANTIRVPSTDQQPKPLPD